jgi:hypothetical protein
MIDNFIVRGSVRSNAACRNSVHKFAVIPAQAGIPFRQRGNWTPVFAGVTLPIFGYSAQQK